LNKVRQKNHIMAFRKIIILSFVLFLAFGIFVESVMSGVCFCGRCFPKAIQDKTDIQINSAFHKSYLGSISKNCRLKNGNSIKAIQFSKQTLNYKILDAFVTSDLNNFYSSWMPDRHNAVKTIGGFQKLPVYLQYLSFRC
jgi:hypothetical protein